MPRLVSREFDQARPTYARRAFIANGHRYKSGDLFDWRRIALSVRKAKQLFDSGHLGHLNEADVVEIEIETEQPVDTLDEKPAEIEVEDNEILAAVVEGDELDAIDDMKELRIIADAEGAPYKVSKADQRQAIRENRG